jgi:hypothetical protein
MAGIYASNRRQGSRQTIIGNSTGWFHRASPNPLETQGSFALDCGPQEESREIEYHCQLPGMVQPSQPPSANAV